MGSRNIPKREQRKPKKDNKKIPSITTIITPPPVVEVIKRGKKEPEFEE